MLAGHTFEGVDRRGKFLRLLLDGLVLVSHLRMEGRYGVYRYRRSRGEAHPCDLPFHRWDGASLQGCAPVRYDASVLAGGGTGRIPR